MKIILHVKLFMLFSLSAICQDKNDSIAQQALGDTQYSHASDLAQKGKYDDARHAFEEASKYYRDSKNWNKFFLACRQKGYWYAHERRYRESVSYLDSIDRQYGHLARESFDSYPLFYGSISWAYLQLYENKLALVALKKIEKSLGKWPDPTPYQVLYTHYYIGVIFQRIGYYNQALIYAQKCLNYAEEHKVSIFLSETYNNLGIIYRNLGEYHRSLEFYNKSMEIGKKSSKMVQLTPIINNIGRDYYYLGEYHKAIERFDYALEITINYTKDYYPILSALTNSKCLALLKLGDYGIAETIASKILEREKEHYGKVTFWSMETLETLGLLATAEGDCIIGEKYFTQALMFARDKYGSKSDKLAEYLIDLGDNSLSQADYLGAARNYQAAIISLIPGFHDTALDQNPSDTSFVLDRLALIRSLKKKANVLNLLNDNDDNIDYLEIAIGANNLAISQIQQVRNKLFYGKSKLILNAQVKPVYEQAISLELKKGKGSDQEKIFQLMEESKAYLLLQAIQKSEQTNSGALPDAITQVKSSLESDVYFAEQGLLRLYINNSSTIKVDSMKRHLFDAKSALESFSLAVDATGQTKNTYDRPDLEIPLQLIQERLSANDLIIEYFTGDSTIYAYALGNNFSKTFPLGAIDGITNQILDISRNISAFSAEQYQSKSVVLYDKLLKNVLEAYPGHTNITIIPDGPLGYLSFDALTSNAIPNPTYKNLSYLVRKYQISQHYLVSLFLDNNLAAATKPLTNQTFIGFAPTFSNDPGIAPTRQSTTPELQALPYAQKEVEEGAQLLNGVALTGDAATKPAFEKAFRNYNIIHLATHTLINDTNPEYSELVFAHDTTSDNNASIHAFELYSMKGNCELVVLSACNTGTGKYYKGEGIASLGRAFIYAGAGSVLTSLWSVSDQSTATIMYSFYSLLNRDYPKEQALRQAKLSFLAQSDEITANPYHWAGFVYLGQTQHAGKSSRWWWLFITIPAVLILVYLRIKRVSTKPLGQRGN